MNNFIVDDYLFWINYEMLFRFGWLGCFVFMGQKGEFVTLAAPTSLIREENYGNRATS